MARLQNLGPIPSSSALSSRIRLPVSRGLSGLRISRRTIREASAAVGAGAGAGTAAVGAATATAVGGWTGVALASATVVLLPVAIIGGAWGMSRAKRSKKEHAIKTALKGCMHERGYDIAGWTKAPKAKGSSSAAKAGT